MIFLPSKQARLNKFLVSLLLINFIAGCGNQHQLVLKSNGMTQTLTDGKSSVPTEFKDFVYPDAVTSGSVSAEGENNEESKFLMLTSKSPADLISKWYQDKLKNNSWKMVTVQEQAGSISIVAQKDGLEFNIMLAEENGATNISLSQANQVEDNSDENSHENFTPGKSTPPMD